MAWIIKNLQARAPMVINLVGGNAVHLGPYGRDGDCATITDEETDCDEVQAAVLDRRCSLTKKNPKPKPEPKPTQADPVNADDEAAEAGTTPLTTSVRRRSESKASKEE